MKLAKRLMMRQSGPALWTPLEIAGAVWVDADAVTINGSTVSEMQDKCGSAILGSQAVTSQQPTLITSGINGKPVMQFDGGDWISFGTQLGRPTNWTVFAVGVFQAVNATQYLCGSVRSDGATAAAWGCIGVTPTGKSEFQFGNESAYRYGQTNNQVFTAGGWFMECHSYASGDALPAKHINGTAQPVVSAAGTATACGGTAYEFSIGRFGAYGTNPLRGSSQVKGVVVAPGVLSVSDRQKLEGCYAHICGLTSLLPSGHPYKTTAP